jgi:alkyl sulfatase BDS1-like metallo-beta-lactamase superfamily hydrolase
MLDGIAVRIDGPRAWDEHLRIAWRITDEDTVHLCELRNGALNHLVVDAPPDGVTTFALTRAVLIGLFTGGVDLAAALADATVTVHGDPADLARLTALLAPADPDFNIVTP